MSVELEGKTAIVTGAGSGIGYAIAERFAREGASVAVNYLGHAEDALGANVPQAWACGAVVHLIAAMLGFEADAPNGALTLTPCLPEWLGSIEVAGLCVGDGSTDFRVSRDTDGNHQLNVTGGSGVDVKLTG